MNGEVQQAKATHENGRCAMIQEENEAVSTL